MRVKFTIAVCALLMLGLAATQVNAQGFNVSKSETDVVQHGRNQPMGAIRLDYTTSGGNIDDGRTIKVNYGSLGITSTAIANSNAASGATLECGEGFGTGTCTAITATIANDEDTGVGTVTINMGTAGRAAGSFVILRGVRADTSGLEAGDTVIAAINSSSAPTGFVPIGQDRTESVGGTVSTVKAGLTVELDAASRLLCNIGNIIGAGPDGDLAQVADNTSTPIGGQPAITVTEGFARAWESTQQSGITATNITIKMLNLPKGVNLRWPHEVMFDDPDEDVTAEWSSLTLTDASRRAAGQANDGANMGVGQETDSTTSELYAATAGDEVTYVYANSNEGRVELSETVTKNVNTEAESFKIEFDVEIAKLADVGAGGISDLWAFLAPAGKSGDDDDRGTILSYDMAPVTDPDTNDGDILNFTECVTYLLFPYLTCGSDASWTTAIAIANTSLDDGVFGISDGAAAQNGDIMLHAFPRSAYGEDGMKTMGDPMRMMLTDSLAAGDTYSATCSTLMPGFEGYAIAKARFRHAHGLAIVLGNFADGAALDVAHGYLALVVPDPEFDNAGRGASSGESLGQ